MQETPSTKKTDASSQIIIICTECQKALPAAEFAKAQRKKSKKGKPCFCLGCSEKKMRGGKTPAKSGASSRAPANEVVPRLSLHILEAAYSCVLLSDN